MTGSQTDWRASAAEHAGDVEAGLRIAADLSPLVRENPQSLLDVLIDLAAGDLTIARVVEPHLDAMVIHAEADQTPASGVWGVFAAEDRRVSLVAEAGDSGWTLTGTKPWCSLADRLDHALVTAQTPEGRRLFAVDLHDRRVTVHDAAGWVAQGLSDVTSVPVDFADVPARPIGAAGWYLNRAGFAWGGIRVAACWYGGLRSLTDFLLLTVATNHPSDRIRLLNLGTADAARWRAELALDEAKLRMADAEVDRESAGLLAARVRAVVAEAAEVVLTQVGHALGPAPLAFNAVHARRVADLTLYVRQHHAERDLAALGATVIEI